MTKTDKQLNAALKKLLRLLKKEKKALIHLDGNLVERIVKEKEQLLDPLSLSSEVPSLEDKKLILHIKELQNDNLLLTRQAIAFNDHFLSAVGEQVKQQNTTYSNKGNLRNQEDIGFINHSM